MEVQERDMETKAKRKRKPLDRASMMALGIAIGAGIGAALGNLGIGIAIGLALGAAIEVAACRKLDNESESA